ncbi:Ig-like domain-containing protein [Daejeonella oryzae]|uniref:Ig-like domain-containing protein n=1 Tax=Daejeonella oryzae TaxID=1122943 RepID=UPI0004227DFD|nr:PKD-like domain-containing protein [Daejeonella oryzae]
MKRIQFLFILLMLCFQAYSQNCTLNVSINSSNNTICSGIPVSLAAVASGGSSYTYSWNTGETTPTISVNKAGTYAVTVIDNASGCSPGITQIEITSAAIPDPPTVSGATICINTTTTLTATAPGGTYQWYDAPSGGNLLYTGSSYTPPLLTGPATYFVETSVSGCPSSRTPVTIFIVPGPTVSGATVCAGSIANISAAGGTSYEWFDTASGGSPIATGSTYTTPPIFESRQYYVQAIVNGCLSNRLPVQVDVIPVPDAPTASGQTICSGESTNLTATGPGGIYRWFDVPEGGNPLIISPDFSTPVLTATKTYYVETSLNGCISKRTAVIVSVNPIPEAPISEGLTICANSTATLMASGSAGSFEWFSKASGGTAIGTGASFTTPPLLSSATYYVQSTVNGCVSPRIEVIVTVNPATANPYAAGVLICSGSNATLTATSPGGTFEWFDESSGGNLLSSEAVFVTPALSSVTTYYVQNTINGCTSSRTPVTVSILPVPEAPAASGVNICAGNQASLSATSSGGKIEWYDAAVGGNRLISNSLFITPVLNSSTTYYVQTVLNNCASSRTAVIVVVDPLPAVPDVTGATVCSGLTASLTATSASGIIEWYDAATGGTLVSTGNSFITPALNANRTYYVQSISANCTSARVPVTASIYPKFNPEFKYSSGTFCSTAPNAIPLINNPAGGTFSASPAGLQFVNTSTGEINISASIPQTYVITFKNNGPCGEESSATLTITTLLDASFSFNNSYCPAEPNPRPFFPGSGSAGSFSASPAGLVFVNTSTGEIDLKASQSGNYTITNTIEASGTCGGDQKTALVTIDILPAVNAGPDQIVPAGNSATLAGTTSNTESFLWTGGLGTFSNPALLNTTYTPAAGETSVVLTLTSNDPAGSCGPQTDNVIINFNAIPPAPTSSDQTICSGNSATLTAVPAGGSYAWFDSPEDGNLLGRGAIFNTPPLISNTSYYVQSTLNGLTSARKEVKVIVNSIPPPPISVSTNICTGSAANLAASGSTGTYQWFDAASGGNLLANTANFTTPVLSSNISYYVQTIVNECVSDRTEVQVTVNPSPIITSASIADLCSNSPQNYEITSNIPGSSFNWSRATVDGISQPGVSNQTSNNINETLTNTSADPLEVNYIIIPESNGCTGTPFTYTLTVNPVPQPLNLSRDTICNGEASNFAVEFNIPETIFFWSRNAVEGIGNPSISNQISSTIKENLYNITDRPVDVIYNFYSRTSDCEASVFNYTVTVNPSALVTSAPFSTICSSEDLNYSITSNIPSASFTWSRPAIADISNPAVSDQNSSTINENLLNTGAAGVYVSYIITPFVNGCAGIPFTYVVHVKPSPVIPPINSNSPVCIGNSIQLMSLSVTGATYTWNGPDNFISTEQNPLISSVSQRNAGTYTLTMEVDGCKSTASIPVEVNEFPVANAGRNQSVCISTDSVSLAGRISGGTTTGVWTSSGTGLFYPINNFLNAKYIPSAEDKAAGSVIMTLTSTSNDDCIPSVSTMRINFQDVPLVSAGQDLEVCAQDENVKLNGQVNLSGAGVWSSSGYGTFSPSENDLKAVYIPSPSDVENGSVILTLSSNINSSCDVVQDELTIRFIPPPTVDAGEDKILLRNTSYTLNPTVNETDVQYRWSPNINISNANIKNPVITANEEITYTLTVTDKRGCVTEDQIKIEVLEALKISNTFTPNGDGFNDFWVIKELVDYPDVKVSIFNRYGEKVYYSDGYAIPWNGTRNGENLPVGTYYYIIQTQLEGMKFSGSITILR